MHVAAADVTGLGPDMSTADLAGNETIRRVGVSQSQREVCDRFGATPLAAPAERKVGISLNVHSGEVPLNAIRHLNVGDTTGWYVWRGEIDPITQADDFFVPLHVAHLDEWCPELIPYLALPPGWGVLLAPGYEDIWFDEKLLVE